MYYSNAMKEVDKFKRDLMRTLLSKLTPAQNEFFLRLYPNGVEGIRDEKMDNAFDQIERTIKKNMANGGEVL
jgi:hypothetical protein